VDGAGGWELSTDPTRLDIDRVHGWLRESYWASDRDRDTVVCSIESSLPYGVYHPEAGQIAFARAVTDLASFAWLCDVVVDPPWRGRGVGGWMMGVIVRQLRSSGVPRLVLTTRDAHALYQLVGFEALRVPSTWMEIDTRSTRPEPGDVGTICE
jgi:GNAT superfamily N-acetyltransferase